MQISAAKNFQKRSKNLGRPEMGPGVLAQIRQLGELTIQSLNTFVPDEKSSRLGSYILSDGTERSEKVGLIREIAFTYSPTIKVFCFASWLWPIEPSLPYSQVPFSLPG